jgi:SAM-dependent methyltransferase
VLDLGLQPAANGLLRNGDSATGEPRYPLRVFLCPNCWLLQITDCIPPAQVFADYPYFSSYAETTVEHARAAAARYIAEFNLGRESWVVEVGSNDGYFLRNFAAAGVPHLGIEPAANIAAASRTRGVETINSLFSADLAMKLAKTARADLILANNVLAHAPDINDFVSGLALLLKPSGRIVLEFPYACDLIEKAEFDTIYHEHVFYFTLTSLVPLFERHGLSIFDVERLAIHGGSLRLFAALPGRHMVRHSVAALLEEEQAKGVTSQPYYQELRDQALSIRSRLLSQLQELKQTGKSIAAYGASAKGSTLLNFCGIGADTIDFVADRSPAKQGHLTPGTHLPIVSAEELLHRQPDYTLLLTWNFADEILSQQSQYRIQGGRFIIPIPQLQIV